MNDATQNERISELRRKMTELAMNNPHFKIGDERVWNADQVVVCMLAARIEALDEMGTVIRDMNVKPDEQADEPSRRRRTDSPNNTQTE